jgi:hypothetical protein
MENKRIRRRGKTEKSMARSVFKLFSHQDGTVAPKPSVEKRWM